jgi:hypothetical protein
VVENVEGRAGVGIIWPQLIEDEGNDIVVAAKTIYNSYSVYSNKRRFTMRLNAPTKNVFWISVALVVLGLLGQLGVAAQLADGAYWLTLAGFILLAAANILKGV